MFFYCNTFQHLPFTNTTLTRWFNQKDHCHLAIIGAVVILETVIAEAEPMPALKVMAGPQLGKGVEALGVALAGRRLTVGKVGMEPAFAWKPGNRNGLVSKVTKIMNHNIICSQKESIKNSFIHHILGAQCHLQVTKCSIFDSEHPEYDLTLENLEHRSGLGTPRWAASRICRRSRRCTWDWPLGASGQRQD